MSESTPNGPNPSAPSFSLYVALSERGTYDAAKDCILAAVPDSVDIEDMEQFLKNEEYNSMPLSEVEDPADILRFFRLFFPNMILDTDNEGQVVIHTGIYPNGEPNDES